jgi:3-oxoacyl-(acyl-carrier-protein) synthase
VTQVGIYGWGIVAPRSPNIDAFARNLEQAGSWLTPFDGFGPNPFLVGLPEFDFAVYKRWIDERFPPNRYAQLVSKMDPTALYGVGCFIQALEQNPGLEEVLQELGPLAHVYLGIGLGAYPTVSDATLQLDRAQRVWDRFWAHPDRCTPLRDYRTNPSGTDPTLAALIPPDPSTFEDEEERFDALRVWNAFWSAHSPELQSYLREMMEIEGISVGGEVEAGKLKAFRQKERARIKLQEKWGAPDSPWSQISTNVLWNIPNTAASQVSMMGRITGFTYAPAAACATFGVCLKLGMDAIREGKARAVVVGAVDPAPHPLTVGAFYGARVLAADGEVSKPLTGLRGTHVSGGGVLWILGDRSFMESKGFRPLGMELAGVGVSADAEHIITPSKEGPLTAIRAALEMSGVTPEEMGSWDLHATATPGDYLEVENMRDLIPEQVLVTARKGTFGHGMSAGGGWELTAQYLGAERGFLYPTALREDELNPEIGGVHQRFVYDSAVPAPDAPMGKLSMGVGGINSCVISRPLRGRGEE